jgi:hypothetical protein
MAKPLSEQLSDLSVSAKKAEDAVAAARKEAQEKVIARREQAHTAAAAAIQKVDRDIKSAGDSVSRPAMPSSVAGVRFKRKFPPTWMR